MVVKWQRGNMKEVLSLGKVWKCDIEMNGKLFKTIEDEEMENILNILGNSTRTI